MRPIASLPWICEKCKQPVAGNRRGVIFVEDHRSEARVAQQYAANESGEHNSADEGGSDVGHEATFVGASVSISEGFDDLVRHLKAPKVEFHVYHEDCSSEGDRWYQIGCSRAPDLDHWMSWMLHMAEKSWLHKEDMRRMIAFWYTGHGQPIPHDLA